VQQFAFGRDDRQATATGPIDSQYVGTHFGEQHACVGTGAEPGEFDDADAVQRASGHQILPLVIIL